MALQRDIWHCRAKIRPCDLYSKLRIDPLESARGWRFLSLRLSLEYDGKDAASVAIMPPRGATGRSSPSTQNFSRVGIGRFETVAREGWGLGGRPDARQAQSPQPRASGQPSDPLPTGWMRGSRGALFSEPAESQGPEWLRSTGPVRILLVDAEPSRKERGHRGVRPRHPNRSAKSEPGRVPQAARSRVDFVRSERRSWRTRSWRTMRLGRASVTMRHRPAGLGVRDPATGRGTGRAGTR
jgi:hypothetical protein